MKSLVPLLLIMCLFAGPTRAEPTTPSPKEIARKTLPSVVMLVMQDDRGGASALGSGFFVADGVVATNVHVIAGAAKGFARITGTTKKLPIAAVIDVDKKHDLALLRIEGAKAAPLKLGDSSRLSVGDAVYAVGNPEGFDGTFSDGLVSGIRRAGKDSLIQISAPISHGSSGGPVVNAQGDVIGVAVATVEEGQNLNFAIPSAYLQALMKKAAASPPRKTTGPRQDKD